MVKADESYDSILLELQEGSSTVRTTMNGENIQLQNHLSTDYVSPRTLHDREFPSNILAPKINLFKYIKVETVSDTTYADSSPFRRIPS